MITSQVLSPFHSNGDDWKSSRGANNAGTVRGFARMSLCGRNNDALHCGWVGDSFAGTLWTR